jgi:cbb3-type cytochrome oxidase subunit 3
MVIVVRKRGIKKARIIHNKKLFWIIIILTAILIALIYFILQNNNKQKNNLNPAPIPNKECEKDSDCVPNSCCHADSCVNINNAPKCDRIFCTQECSGPLDCGTGTCACVNNKCSIISNNK